MKKIRRNILVALTVIAMFATTGVGVFATEGAPDQSTEPTTVSDELEGTDVEQPATEVEVPETDVVEPLRSEPAKAAGTLQLNVFATDTTAEMQWAGDDATSYDVKVTMTKDAEGTAVSEPVDVTTPVSGSANQVEGLVASSEYEFQIGLHEEGQDPQYTDSVKVTTGVGTLEPVETKVYSSYKEMVVKWAPVENANAYIVERNIGIKKGWNDDKDWSGWEICRTVSPLIKNSYYTQTATMCTFKNVSGIKGAEFFSSSMKLYTYRYRVTAVQLQTDAAGKLVIKDPTITNIHNIDRYMIQQQAEANTCEHVKTCVKPMYITVQPKMNRALTSKNKVNGKRKTVTFKSGSDLECYGFNAGWYYFKKKLKYKKNGKTKYGTYTFRIARVNAKNQKAHYTKELVTGSSDNYLKTEAELFVNKYMREKYGKAPKGSARWYTNKGKGKAKYVIWVSFYTQHMYILKQSGTKWKMASSLKDKYFKRNGEYRDNWESSTGKASTPSYTGINQINNNRAYYLKGIHYWSGYHGTADKSGNFNGIHGRQPSYVLGEPHSHACIRNDENDAKLIYNTWIQGTRVICY